MYPCVVFAPADTLPLPPTPSPSPPSHIVTPPHTHTHSCLTLYVYTHILTPPSHPHSLPPKGISKGTKDRYFLSPGGRVLRTRAEAEAKAWGRTHSRQQQQVGVAGWLAGGWRTVPSRTSTPSHPSYPSSVLSPPIPQAGIHTTRLCPWLAELYSTAL